MNPVLASYPKSTVYDFPFCIFALIVLTVAAVTAAVGGVVVAAWLDSWTSIFKDASLAFARLWDLTSSNNAFTFIPVCVPTYCSKTLLYAFTFCELKSAPSVALFAFGIWTFLNL